MKKLQYGLALSLLSLSSLSYASFPYSSPNEQAGVFVGLGGSYNSVKVKQHLNVNTTATVISPFDAILGFGSDTLTDQFIKTENTFAPEVQAGYYRFFPCSDWFWGFKFSYQYLGVNADIHNINDGSGTVLTSPAIFDFSSLNTQIQSLQVNVSHQMNFLAFSGKHFSKGGIYLGVGPVLFGTQAKVNNISSNTTFDGFVTNSTGTRTSLSSDRWIWGGAAQLGATYEFAPMWFFDFTYTYAISQSYTSNRSGTFSTLSIFDGPVTTTGTVNASAKRQIIAQAATVTVNKDFNL